MLAGRLRADVIRVAMPGDEGCRQPFIGGTMRSFAEETINRNKRNRDRSPPIRGVDFLALVTSADVVVENFKPGTFAGWGIGYDDCRKVKQDIVSVGEWMGTVRSRIAASGL